MVSSCGQQQGQVEIIKSSPLNLGVWCASEKEAYKGVSYINRYRGQRLSVSGSWEDNHVVSWQTMEVSREHDMSKCWSLESAHLSSGVVCGLQGTVCGCVTEEANGETRGLGRLWRIS